MGTEISLKRRIFLVIDDHKSRKPLNRIFHGLLFALILASSFILVLETVKSIYSRFTTLFILLEVFTMFFFSLEYVLRIYTCTEIRQYRHPFFGRLKYIFTPLMLIDILSIIPFYLILYNNNPSGYFIFSIFRVLRLFKAIRYVKAFKVIGQVFYLKREQLFVSFIFIIFIFVFASSMIYIVEKDAQPEKFSNVPSAMWYTIVTITTVGYGDIYPITPLGKTIGGFTSMIGLILFAIPTSILTSGFLKINQSSQTNRCPHCGKEL